MDRLAPWLSRTRLTYLALAVLLASAAVWVSVGQDPGRRLVQATGTVMSPMATMPAPPAEPGPLVHVVGAVRRPGLYRLLPGARTMAAVRRAGGATRTADLAGINLAAPVNDGQQIVVPAKGHGTAAASGQPGSGPGAPVPLSTADATQLETLDGIGPALAQRIITWRTDHGGFGSVDQLLDVPGIGPAKLAAIRDRVTP